MEAIGKLIFSVKEATRILGIGRTSLWKLRAKGKLGYLTLGGRVMFTHQHLTDLLKLAEHKKAA